MIKKINTEYSCIKIRKGILIIKNDLSHSVLLKYL